MNSLQLLAVEEAERWFLALFRTLSPSARHREPSLGARAAATELQHVGLAEALELTLPD